MANLPISGLTASAANLAGTDLLPVVQTVGVGPVQMTGLQIAGGLLGSTALTGATVTTSKPVLDLSQTWNASGTTFTGLKFNATDTASAAGSLLLDIGTGGASYSSKFNVDKSGVARSGAFRVIGNDFLIGQPDANTLGFLNGANWPVGIRATVFSLASNVALGWSNSSQYGYAGQDVFLARDAANTLALKNSTNPQIFRAYSTTTGPSYGYMAAGVTDAGVAAADTLTIGTGGAGAAITKLAFAVNGTNRLTYGLNASYDWTISGSSSSIVLTGGSGYPGISLISGSSSRIDINLYGIYQTKDVPFGWSNSAANLTTIDTMLYRGSAAGVIAINGTTSSFPALKRTSAALTIRLADDSANAALTCGTTTASGTALNVTGTGDASIMSVTNVTTGTLLNVVNSASSSMMSVTDTVTGDLLTVYNSSAAAVFNVNDSTATGVQIVGLPFGLSGNISAAAWGTAGIRFKNTSVTLTDTSTAASGTVATGYTNVYGGNTIAATNTSVTYTTYATTRISGPTAGTNITITNPYALSLGGSVQMDDAANIAAGTTTGTKIGTATGQKIGFWNATPIVQPTTGVAAATVAATGTGDVVAASTTFDGYTIPQIVKALRNAGLLA